MTQWRVRDLQATDLDGVLRLWQQYERDVTPVYSLNEVLASARVDTAVVATVGDQVVGVAVARAAHDQAWIVFLAVDDDWRQQGISRGMLAALEQRLAPEGIQRMSILVPDGEEHVAALSKAGYADQRHLRYFEREIPVRQDEILRLRELGGRLLPHDRWGKIGGMQREKDLLENRLVLPLAQPERAEEFGVVPPRSIVLFGPPGTGKTTFAKAIASRLEWPFVEVFPSRLASSPLGLTGELRETFEKIDDLDHAVVFIDEVEEIAVKRGGEPPSPMQGVTNELLKVIPAFRERPGRLLICATNFIRALDPGSCGMAGSIMWCRSGCRTRMRGWRFGGRLCRSSPANSISRRSSRRATVSHRQILSLRRAAHPKPRLNARWLVATTPGRHSMIISRQFRRPAPQCRPKLQPSLQKTSARWLASSRYRCARLRIRLALTSVDLTPLQQWVRATPYRTESITEPRIVNAAINAPSSDAATVISHELCQLPTATATAANRIGPTKLAAL